MLRNWKLKLKGKTNNKHRGSNQENVVYVSIWVLTELIPMKFNRGFAPEIRNKAWRRPRMPPITSADEADGICLLSGSILTTSKLLPSVFGRYVPSMHSKYWNNTELLDILHCTNSSLKVFKWNWSDQKIWINLIFDLEKESSTFLWY